MGAEKVYNRTTSVPDLIEADLYDHNQKSTTDMRGVDSIGNMATPEGLKRIVSEASKWMELNRKSLMYAPFSGQITRGNSIEGCILEFNMETASLQLLKISSS